MIWGWQMDNMVDQSILMPVICSKQTNERFHVPIQGGGVMCQSVEGHCYRLMMGSHLHWGTGAGGWQGEEKELQEINNSHYVSVNASRRVSRGRAGPALPGSSNHSSHHSVSCTAHHENH